MARLHTKSSDGKADHRLRVMLVIVVVATALQAAAAILRVT